MIDPDFKNTGSDSLRSNDFGAAITVTTLDNIVRQLGDGDALLKIDCEGAEYPILLGASDETLQRFDEIIIEYHYGYLDLEKLMRRAGFQVSHTTPYYSVNYRASDPIMFVGQIYCTRIAQTNVSDTPRISNASRA